MNNDIALQVNNDEIVVSSLQIAEDFGKLHKHVLTDIKNLVDGNSSAKLFFFRTTYDNRGKQYPMYLMNRDGFTLLAMGFTGKKAIDWKLKYIEAFNRMEKKLNTPELQMARGMMVAQKMLENKEAEIKALQTSNRDKENMLVLAMGNGDRYTVTEISKYYHMSPREFNQLLRRMKIQKRKGNIWVLTKRYEDQPFMIGTTKTFWDYHTHTITEQVKFNCWTKQGLVFLYNILKDQEGLYPDLDVEKDVVFG